MGPENHTKMSKDGNNTCKLAKQVITSYQGAFSNTIFVGKNLLSIC